MGSTDGTTTGIWGPRRQLWQGPRPGTRQRPALRRASRQALTLGRWNEAINLANKAIEPIRCGRTLQQPRPHIAGSQPRYGGRGRVSQGAGTRSRRGLGIRRSGGPSSCRARPRPPCGRCSRKRMRVWRLSGLPLAFHALGRRSDSDAALAALKERYARETANQIAEVHAFRGEDGSCLRVARACLRPARRRPHGHQGRPADARARRRSTLQGVSAEAEAPGVSVRAGAA